MLLKFRIGITRDGYFGVALEECLDKYEGGRDCVRRANMDVRLADIFRENMKSVMVERSELAWVGAIATWRTVRRFDNDRGTSRVDYHEKNGGDLKFKTQARRIEAYLRDPENKGKAQAAHTKAEV